MPLKRLLKESGSFGPTAAATLLKAYDDVVGGPRIESNRRKGARGQAHHRSGATSDGTRRREYPRTGRAPFEGSRRGPLERA
jgi:hypothetical protein